MRSHLRFTKQEKRGIFFLLLLISVIQVGYYLFATHNHQDAFSKFEIDSIALHYIDSVKRSTPLRKDLVIRPFNPNFIQDYKGYLLGLSPAELDRLYSFREKGSFVQTAEEFQRVTLISDSLLTLLSPYFKFPDFTRYADNEKPVKREIEKAIDLNSATEGELRSISGIGTVLARRILKFRKSLGGFLEEEQLYDVYGLEPEVAKKAIKKFKVFVKPAIIKININSASAGEISSLVYINRHLAEQIVAYRNELGKFDSIAQLTKIEDFPTTKIHRIALYLAL